MLDWEAVIDEHGPLVVRISWRILGHASDVEDNVQEVFLDAYRLEAKEPIRHWRGLLRRLATLGALVGRAASVSELLACLQGSRPMLPGPISCSSWVTTFGVARASCPCFSATGKMPVLRKLEN